MKTGAAGVQWTVWAILTISFIDTRAQESMDLNLIATRVPVTFNAQKEIQFESQLFLIKPDGDKVPLTASLYQAQQGALDFDGKSIYFSGRRYKDSPAQIWSLNIDQRNMMSLTQTVVDSLQPQPMPDRRLVYIEDGEVIRLNMEQGHIEQLTASGAKIKHINTLRDGRIHLIVARGDRQYAMLMQPDGTWLTAFGDRSFASVDRVFIEGDSVWYSADQMLTHVFISDPFSEHESYSVRPPKLGHHDLSSIQNQILFSLRRDKGSFGVYGFGNNQVATLIHETNYHWIQPLILNPRRPLALLPSIVKTDLDYAYLVIIDAFRLPATRRPSDAKVDIYTGDVILASHTPEPDGSLYLKVPADLPLRLALRDNNGTVISKMTDPIWVRPNERRMCIGCHISPRYAPPNRAIRALDRDPWIVPRHEATP